MLPPAMLWLGSSDAMFFASGLAQTCSEASYPKDDLDRAAEAINYFTPEHIPVFDTIAQNFVLIAARKLIFVAAQS
jgi:hypothetical protein